MSDTTKQPPVGQCARCGQTRPLFQPRESWGRVPDPLCSTDWQKYAEARANRGFVDFNDAFFNASDERLGALMFVQDGGV